ISAEQRFTTSVPLQRLFFMNSDFMQQQGELLARRVSSEPDTRARIRKAYRLIYGREPAEAEMTAGAAYIAQEPMRAYEERKADAARKPDAAEKKPKAAEDDNPDDENDPEGGPRPMTGDGMMSGVVPGAGGKDESKLLPVTALGRYMKILLSASEFLFVS
ncbi:MAG TPA: DUF1553 domain-containing protein, partial [Vicinamibacterales bacterium]|nr:DUF1553 domain-containing protein [Vicinamibacterales bacterium]